MSRNPSRTHPFVVLVTAAAVVGIAALITAFAVLLFASAAHGSDEPAVRGQSCAKIGEHRKNRSGTEYVCEQRRGDSCPVWHAAHPTKGPWSKPSPCLCPSKSPSVSPPPSPSKSTSTSPSPSRSATPGQSTTSSMPPVDTPGTGTTPVGNTLPVTGTPTVIGAITVFGFLCLLGGGALLVFGVRRTR
jgi:hypothetical protein